jgi:FMN-dependent NADH-azoreductase
MSNHKGNKAVVMAGARTLLRIDASPRNDDRSRSRQLTTRFEEVWRAHNPTGRVVRRDLRLELPPHVDQEWIEAAFAADDRRLPAMRRAIATSDALVDEFLAADEYVLGVPMHNFGLPSSLKAWADNVVRVGRTFSFIPDDPAGRFYRPLVPHGRRATVIVTSGDAGYEPGGPIWHMNHVEPHLRTIFDFVGITDLRFVYSGNDEFGGDRLQRSLEAAARRVVEVATPTAAIKQKPGDNGDTVKPAPVSNGESDPMDSRNPTPEDRFEIVDALNRFAAGQDLRDPALFSSAFTPNAELDFVQPAGKLGVELPVFKGRDNIVSTISAALSEIDTTRTVTNTRVGLEGDKATLFALVEAQHLPRSDIAATSCSRTFTGSRSKKPEDAGRLRGCASKTCGIAETPRSSFQISQ